LSEDTDVASSYAPNSPTITQAQAHVRGVLAQMRTQGDSPSPVIAYGRLKEPLTTIISLLRAQLMQTGRQHELSDQLAEQAPPAYRAAVADYFERLSRDYGPAPGQPAK
jgi:hypothetical protein